MRLIDADVLKEAIIKHLCVKSENNLLPAEKSIYNLIDKQPTLTLELQKGKQPKKVDRCTTIVGFPTRHIGRCPSCGCTLDMSYNTYYCGQCGEGLDWDDDS